MFQLFFRHLASAALALAGLLLAAETVSAGSVLAYFPYFILLGLCVLLIALAPPFEGRRALRTLFLAPAAVLPLAYFYSKLPEGSWRWPLVLSGTVLAVALLFAIAYPGDDEEPV